MQSGVWPTLHLESVFFAESSWNKSLEGKARKMPGIQFKNVCLQDLKPEPILAKSGGLTQALMEADYYRHDFTKKVPELKKICCHELVFYTCMITHTEQHPASSDQRSPPTAIHNVLIKRILVWTIFWIRLSIGQPIRTEIHFMYKT